MPHSTGILERTASRLRREQDVDGLGIGDAREVGGGHMIQALKSPLSTNLFSMASSSGQRSITSSMTYLSMLGQLHIVLKIGEGNLGLHHPELGGVARRVGVLRAESGAERVHVAEGHGEVLGVQAGHGERGGLAEEIGAPIHLAGHKRAPSEAAAASSLTSGTWAGSMVVTRNISPALSQSLAVMMGVCT